MHPGCLRLTQSIHRFAANGAVTEPQLDADPASREFCVLWKQLVVVMRVQCQNLRLVRCLKYDAYPFIHNLSYLRPFVSGNRVPVFSIFGVPDNFDPVLRDPSSYFQCYISSHPLFTFSNPNAISLAHDAGEALEKVSKSRYTSGHDRLCGDPVLRFPSHPLLRQHFPLPSPNPMYHWH